MASKIDMVLELLKTHREDMKDNFNLINKKFESLQCQEHRDRMDRIGTEISLIKEREKMPFRGGGLTGSIFVMLKNLFR